MSGGHGPANRGRRVLAMAAPLFVREPAGRPRGGVVVLHDVFGVTDWASITSLFVYATNVSLYLYTPELYPTRNRALGASFGGVTNRLGVIAGPIVVGTILGAGGSIVTVFTVLGAVALVGALTALFAEETKGRTLEELNS